MDQHKNYFHLHMISDSTGETLLAASRAAAAQFETARALEHVYPLIRTQKQVEAVMDAVDGAPGIVLYTIVDPEIADFIDARCAKMGLPSVSVLDPVLQAFQIFLGAPQRKRVGGQHLMNEDYFARIDALNYTMEHDDGQNTNSLAEADVVILGISRTSKTPTSVYLANRGIKTANIPLIRNMDLPAELLNLEKTVVVGLVATVDRIAQVRQNRELGVTHGYEGQDYIDRSNISAEISFTRSICKRHDWPLIDVTRKSIEETAAAILAIKPKWR